VKITRFETFLVSAGVNYVFVQVHTDEGLVGLGDGTVATKALAVEAAIRDLERLVVGRDPTNIEGLWQEMFRRPRWRGGPVLNSAISAVEIALWDILGQSLGVPIWKLLGGACRDRIRVYGHVHGDTPEEAAESARSLVEQGFTAVKTSPLVVHDNVVRAAQGMREGVARVRAIREAVGEDVDVMLDAHGQLTPEMAVEMAQRVAEYRPLFLEETTQPDDLSVLEWVSQRSPVPLATGERLFTKYEFTEICSRQLVRYVQPDVLHCGGISEMKKIAAIAEAYYIHCAPHNPQSFISAMASFHVDACTPNCVIQEFVWGPEWQKELFEGAPVIVDGFAELPSEPGLGVKLNVEAARAHPYEPDFRPPWHWEDGSVADW